MKLLSEKVGANWDDVIQGFLRDGRIGHSHWQVPGPDGKLGFGGSCFPKDVQALIKFGEEQSIDLSVLKGAWKTNLLVRPEKDWEDSPRRALVDSEEDLELITVIDLFKSFNIVLIGDRKKFFLVSAILILVVLIEILGLGLISFLIINISNLPKAINNVSFFNLIFSFLSPSPEDILLIFILFINGIGNH